MDELFKGDYINKCVIIDTGKLWIDDQCWLENLSKSDFFLCPPGISMPMCHNAIEAMSVGTIPIINYPEWFSPSLIHMENCIIYDDETDLLDKIDCALNLEKPKLAEMRKKVIDYYNSHLNPVSFINKLEFIQDNKQLILITTGNYVAKNASKLNKHSILLSD